MSSVHTVLQGEHLSGIANQYGFRDYHIIWDHPNNSALRQNRQDPHILFPGDSIFIPDKQSKSEDSPTAQIHRFQLKKPRLVLRLVLKDFDDLPIANVDCDLEVEGTTYKLKTGSSGQIVQEIVATAKTATLRVPELDLCRSLKIGYLDPSEEESGWKARLQNLGYFHGSLKQEEEEILTNAIEEFQCDHGLQVTGKLDKPTRSKIKQLHGC